MFTPGGQLDLHTFAGMRGGGKGGGGAPQQLAPTVYTDPVDGTVYTDYHSPFYHGPSASEQLNAHIAARKAQEQTASDTAAQTAKDTSAANETAFQGKRQSAYDNALAAVRHTFDLQGINPDTYMTSDIVPTLQRQFSSIQDLDPNPSAAFAPNLADQILGQITGGVRTKANTALNNVFTPDYAQKLIPDESTNSIVQSILDEQFNPLSSQLVNAQKRGTLTDAGFKAAQDALTSKRTAAQATVQNLGNTILGTDRSDIEGIIGNARSRAASLGANDVFDPGTYVSQAQSKATSDIGNLGGAIRSQLGDTQFASLQDLINAGGVVQGATAPTATNPTAGGAIIPDDPLASQKRGLGNQGAF